MPLRIFLEFPLSLYLQLFVFLLEQTKLLLHDLLFVRYKGFSDVPCIVIPSSLASETCVLQGTHSRLGQRIPGVRGWLDYLLRRGIAEGVSSADAPL